MCPEARHASAMRASCSNRCRVSSAAQWATGATRTASASIAFQSITHPRRVTVAPSQRAPTGWRSSVLSACADNARSPQNTSHCKSASMCRRKCTLRTCAPRCTPTLFHRWSSFPSPPLGHSSINPGGGGWPCFVKSALVSRQTGPVNLFARIAHLLGMRHDFKAIMQLPEPIPQASKYQAPENIHHAPPSAAGLEPGRAAST